MQEWWSSLMFTQKFFWVIATFSSSIFILQSLMTLVGFQGDSGDVDGSHDEDSSHSHAEDPSDTGFSFAQYFTSHNMVAFFMGFSWSGLACLDYGIHIIFTGLISSLVGVVFVAVVVSLLTGLSKLSSDGTVRLKSAIGSLARVSIEIPALYEGQGKVSMTISEVYREMVAVTGESKPLKRNQEVKVVGVVSNQLVVEKTN